MVELLGDSIFLDRMCIVDILLGTLQQHLRPSRERGARDSLDNSM